MKLVNITLLNLIELASEKSQSSLEEDIKSFLLVLKALLLIEKILAYIF